MAENALSPSPSTIQVGIDSFAARYSGDGETISDSQSLRNLVERIERADAAGLDAFGVGEHHRSDFLDSAPVVILAAAASRTRRIRLCSAVTVLSAADPVRVFQNFATLDLLSEGRAEIVAGRGSFTEAYPLFGLRLEDYDSLFSEKLDLLLQLREEERVTWSGRHRPPLRDQAVYPRPMQKSLPIWVGVGGTPDSFIRAGMLGLPLMVAIIGGETRRFRPLVDLYREAGRRAGHAPETLKVGVHAVGYVAETTEQAIADFTPATRGRLLKSGANAAGRRSRVVNLMRSAASMAHFWSAIRAKSPRRSSPTARRLAGSRASLFRWMSPASTRKNTSAASSSSAPTSCLSCGKCEAALRRSRFHRHGCCSLAKSKMLTFSELHEGLCQRRYRRLFCPWPR